MSSILHTALLWLFATALHAAPLSFVEANIDTTTPWVQSQATLRLRFFQATAVNDIKLAAPQSQLADIQPLGGATISEIERDGRHYRMHEQHFAILPFASGHLELTGAGASGRLPGSSRRTHWPTPVLVLTVRPAPPHISDWLPARTLRLSESWSVGTLAIGQTLLRTVRIEANGVSPTQLPGVALEIAGASVLAHPPRFATHVTDKALVAIREQDFEILPTRSGHLVIPGLPLAWWSVGSTDGATRGTGEMAVATLPGRSFEISGPAAPPAPASALLPHRGFYAGLTLILVLLFLWLAPRIRAFWLLWRACRSGGIPALIDWGRQRFPAAPPGNLIALAERLPEDKARTLRALDSSNYGQAQPRPSAIRVFAALARVCLR